MFKQTCLVTASVTLLSACSLFHSGFGSKPIVDAPRDLTIQDPHWRRFYELEQEIAQLKSRLNAKSAQVSKTSIQSNQESSTTSLNGDSDAFLMALRAQTSKAVAAIDSAIESLEKDPVDDGQTQPPANIVGSLKRGQQGKVLQQVDHTQTRQSTYNFSVVYVYREPQPWNDMWQRLEDSQEQDKWRGFNPDKLSYFIYVGAYLRQEDAEKRQHALLASVGEGPELRANHRSGMLAAK